LTKIEKNKNICHEIGVNEKIFWLEIGAKFTKFRYFLRKLGQNGQFLEKMGAK